MSFTEASGPFQLPADYSISQVIVFPESDLEVSEIMPVPYNAMQTAYGVLQNASGWQNAQKLSE